MDHRLHVVVFKEGSAMVGQCLEHDIAVQGDSLAEVLKELDRTLLGQILISIEAGVDPFDSFGPAPQRYKDLYDGAPMDPYVRRLEMPELPEVAKLGSLETELRVA